MYLFSFWFWLDTISTLSLLVDIPAVQSRMTSAGASREDKLSSLLRAAVRAFQLIRISRLLKARPSPALEGGGVCGTGGPEGQIRCFRVHSQENLNGLASRLIGSRAT